MLTDFTIDDSFIGQTIGPPDGFLVSLSQSAPSSDRADPQFSISLGRYLTGYLQLRGERDHQAIYCNRSGQWTPYWSGDNRVLISDQSLDYHGQLVVQCVPRGATYTLTLSDIPFVRAPAERGGGPFARNVRGGVWGTTAPR
jgi:hypothetical protein